MWKNQLQTCYLIQVDFSFPTAPQMYERTKFQNLLRWKLLCNEIYHIEIFTA